LEAIAVAVMVEVVDVVEDVVVVVAVA